MSNFYIGQIMMTGFGFAQKGFAMCNGQLLSIQQNQALFSLLGTNYGGNGVNTFALPDLRSRTPVGAVPSQNPSWQPPQTMPGEMSGVEQVTLLATQLPMHNHMATVTSDAATNSGFRGTGLTLASSTDNAQFYGSAASTPLSPQTVQPGGGSQPHNNLQPYTTINFNIALVGIFPSRN